MADNLAFDVIAKTQPARDELQLLNAQIRATTSEVKKLAAEANKDPLAIPKFRAANLELTKLKVTADGLNKTLHRGKEEAEGFAESLSHLAHGNRPIARLLSEFSSLGGGIETTAGILGRFVGGFAGGVAALAVFKGFEILKDTVGEANKALGELKKTAGEIGVRPVALKAVQVAAEEAGHEIDAATKVYEGFGKVIEENRNKFSQPVVGGAGLPTVLSGGTLSTPTPGRVSFPGAAGAGGRTVQVGRGGQPGLTDPTKALDDLDLSRFQKTEEGVENAARALQARVLELQKTMNSVDFNIFAKAKFGVSGKELGEIADDMEAMEKIVRRLVGPLSDATKQLERLAAARGKLNAVRETAIAPAVRFFNEADITIMTALTHFFQAPWAEIISAEFAKIPGNIQANFIGPVTQDWSNFVNGLTSTWTSFCDGIVSVATAAAATIQSIWGGIKGAAAGAGASIAAAAQQGAVPGMASGGYVHGAGSGTSDSILARLSAGEFVVNAASVRRLGTSFLSGLNGFAAGGLVGVPRFAAGGLVATAGGRPVHLHLGSGSFALSGSESVVGALVAEAGRQQMRSAGVKPSWYGGRPGA